MNCAPTRRRELSLNQKDLYAAQQEATYHLYRVAEHMIGRQPAAIRNAIQIKKPNSGTQAREATRAYLRELQNRLVEYGLPDTSLTPYVQSTRLHGNNGKLLFVASMPRCLCTTTTDGNTLTRDINYELMNAVEVTPALFAWVDERLKIDPEKKMGGTTELSAYGEVGHTSQKHELVQRAAKELHAPTQLMVDTFEGTIVQRTKRPEEALNKARALIKRQRKAAEAAKRGMHSYAVYVEHRYEGPDGHPVLVQVEPDLKFRKDGVCDFGKSLPNPIARAVFFWTVDPHISIL